MNDEHPEQKPTPKMPIGATIGVTIGVFGWLIGFAIVCIVTGKVDALLAFLLPASAVNLGLAAFYILVTDHALRRHGRGSMFQLVHWGALAWMMGLLLMLINGWIAPAIDSSPEMVETIHGMCGVYRTHDLWATLLLALGSGLLAVYTVKMIRRP